MSQWGQQQPGFQYPLQTGFPLGNPQLQQQGSQFQLQPQNPQQFQQQQQPGLQSTGLLPQPTGFVPQRPLQQGLPPQPAFVAGASGFLQPQPTGFPISAGNFQQPARQPIPPVPPLPSQYQNVQNRSLVSAQPLQQPGSFLAPTSSFLNPGVVAQPTGFVGRTAPLLPQVTGFLDPRLQIMSTTFMPANVSSPYSSGGLPQLPPAQLPGGLNLQQSFQEHNQAQHSTSPPKLSWVLTKNEKKSYDAIFRAWDTQGTGFINGQTALEVFGQSGLDKNDLAKVWNLADIDDRGKLNLAEFHVAMGLIYRRLSGLPIPDELPPELVPPSARDLDTSVNLLKDILKHDTRSRSPSALDAPVSRLKDRSFNSSGGTGVSGRDATVYRHTDDEPPGGIYQSRARFLDRSAIRARGDDSPSSDLSDMKRQLENTAKMLDKAAADQESRTAEDEALDREMEDLKYRIKRVQQDLEYVTKGPRSSAKDEERRKLERDLMKLMHERVPEVERKIEERERRREREERQWARDRDRRNERLGRFDSGDLDRRSPRYEDRDQGYSKGSYDRDYNDRGSYRRSRSRSRSRDRDRRGSRSRSRDRDYKPRDRSPPTAARSTPPPRATPAAPTPPALTPSPQPTRNMTAAERQAFIREQAQQRLQARKAALGVTAPSAAPVTDTTSVQERLAQEQKEAEEKVKEAERFAAEREAQRKERIEAAKAMKGDKATSPVAPGSTGPRSPLTANQVPAPRAAAPRAAAPPAKVAPPPPKPRARPAAPQPPKKAPPPVVARTSAPAPVTPAAPAVPVAPPVPIPRREPSRPAATVPPKLVSPVQPSIDPQEEKFRYREEALRKQRAEHAERLRQLERDEEEALRKQREAREERVRQLEREEEDARKAEEEYQARRQKLLEAKRSPSPTSSSPVVVSPPVITPSQSPTLAASPVAPAPPSLQPVSPVDRSTTNPFNRFMKDSSGTSPANVIPATDPTSTNPFFRPQTATIPVAPVKSPAPPSVKASYHTAPGNSEDEWDDIAEKNEDDSDDELASSRDTRQKIAQQLFGSVLPPARPQTASPPTVTGTQGTTPTAPSPPPLSGPAVPTFTIPSTMPPLAPPLEQPPPPPPLPPPALFTVPPPQEPSIVAAATPSPAAQAGDVSALMKSIQGGGGARLKKAVTNDRSAASISGRVLGDTAPPAHINLVSQPSSPLAPTFETQLVLKSLQQHSRDDSTTQSVDWLQGLATEQGNNVHNLPPTAEEGEDRQPPTLEIPQIHVLEPAMDEQDLMRDVDTSIEYKVRTLYAWEGARPEDLAFTENNVLIVHPSKSGGDWWYGTSKIDGKSGFVPKTFVQMLENIRAKALYPYTANNADELSLEEGEEFVIVDRSDAEWWKVEMGGMVFMVPATFLEIVEAASTSEKSEVTDPVGNEGRTPDGGNASISMEDELSSSGSEDDFHSLPDSSDEENDDQNARNRENDVDREARENERRLVLEAAGLVVKQISDSPKRQRPPAPAAPRLKSSSVLSDKELPPFPDLDLTGKNRVDDAFERYEEFKKAQEDINLKRLSSASSIGEAYPSLPSPTSIASRDGESRGYSNFFHFFGRTKSTENEKPKSSLVISGPISDPNDIPRRENSPAFGMSWASLVDKEALEGIPPGERRRQEAIFELIATEAAYVRDLQLIVEVFYSSMLSLLEEKAITVVFANVEDLLLTNTTFLSLLEARQKECRLYVDKIGDIVHDCFSHMGIYMEYCTNQSRAITVLQSLRESDPTLEAHLQNLKGNPSVRSLDLSSYMLVPMQRITRYPLLIRQILKNTDPDQDPKEHRDISESVRMAEKLLHHINETIRDQEGNERLKQLSQRLWIGQGRLDLREPTRNMGERKLLREGPLTKAKSGRKIRGFLCTDILILTDDAAKTLYRLPMPLIDLKAMEVQGGKDDLVTFQIVRRYPRGGDSIALRGTSGNDAQMWIEAINVASSRCREAHKQELRRYSS